MDRGSMVGRLRSRYVIFTYVRVEKGLANVQ